MASSARHSSRPPRAAPLLVGREREQRVLRDALDAAIGGWGRLVLIGGEAGIGKTALAESIYDEAATYGARAFVGRCYDLTETPPYGPWLDLFAHLTPTNDDPALPAAFAERGTVGAAASPTALFNPVRDFFAAMASRQPVVLLLDDLHWADPASLDLLRFLARELATIPLLLIATYRAEEVQRTHPLYALLPTLAREAHAERIGLHRLEMDDMRALVAARYALAPVDEARLVIYLHTRTAGNAFFTVELLHALEEARTLRQVDGRWLVGDLLGVQAPPLLRQVIDGRLARLGEPTQRLLAAAAVIGQEVPLALWATVTGEDEETLLAIAERAVAAHLVEETTDATRVRFVHALIQESLNEELPLAQRRAWHRAVGDALAAAATLDPNAVAYHFRQAGDRRAAEWLIKAGEQAIHTHAFATAVSRFEESLPLLHETDHRTIRGEVLVRLAALLRLTDTKRSIAYADEAVQIADETEDCAMAAIAIFHRGSVNGYAGNYRQGLNDLERVADLLAALPTESRTRLDRIGRVNLNNGAMLHVTIANTLQVLGRYDDALQTLARVSDPAHASLLSLGLTGMTALCVVRTALGQPDEARAASAIVRDGLRTNRDYIGVTHATEFELSEIVLPYQADRLEERRRLAEEAERAYQQAGDTSTGFSPRTARVGLLVVEGEWAEARMLLTASHRAGGLPGWRLAELRLLGHLARAQGDAEQAWSLIRGALPVGPSTEPGEAMFFNACAFQRLAAALALDADDRVIARAWLDAHDRWLTWSGIMLGRSDGALLWARYHRATSDGNAAQERAEQALADATAPRQPLALLAAHRLLGELATDAGRYEDAATHLDAALTLADACAAPYERALTLLSIAVLRGVSGDTSSMSAPLNEARDTFTRLDAKPALARVGRIALGLLSAAKPTYPACLSAREVDVLRLVADGLTNMQIAERLFLSPRTVNGHLTTIYTKLSVPSRAAAIRFALDHGLT